MLGYLKKKRQFNGYYFALMSYRHMIFQPVLVKKLTLTVWAFMFSDPIFCLIFDICRHFKQTKTKQEN